MPEIALIELGKKELGKKELGLVADISKPPKKINVDTNTRDKNGLFIGR